MIKRPLAEICHDALGALVEAADNSPLSFEESSKCFKVADGLLTEKAALETETRAVNLPWELIGCNSKRLCNLPKPNVKVLYKFGNCVYTGYFDNSPDVFGFWCDEEFAPADNVSGWMYYE